MPTKLNKPKVLGVLAGADYPLNKLGAWTESADVILAADGGANALMQIGVIPALTVGDLDSISLKSRSLQHELVHIEEQNSTDVDKLLMLADERGISEISLIGIEGDLLDHTIGTLLSAAKSNLQVRLILRRGLAYVLHGPIKLSTHLPEATRLSLIPIADCTGVTITGAQWPLSNADLSPLGLTSLSNSGSGLVQVEIKKGPAILFLLHPDFEEIEWEWLTEQAIDGTY